MFVHRMFKHRYLETLSLVALGTAGFFVSYASAQTVQTVTPVPNVNGSHAYLAAAYLRAPEDLNAVGYSEQEYFISGLANAYKYNNPSDPTDDSVSTLQPNPEPYTNRILVRAPKDPARFSGNVILDLGDPRCLGGGAPAIHPERRRLCATPESADSHPVSANLQCTALCAALDPNFCRNPTSVQRRP